MDMDDRQRHVRVVLADGHALFREAITSVLDAHAGISVVADAGDGPDAIAKALQLRPDCVFVDVELPGIDGIEVTQRIKDRLPECAVIVLAPSEDDVPLVAAIEAGASGFLTKDCPLTDLITATHAVLEGEMVVPPRLLAPLLSGLMRHRREQDEAMRRLARLTRREREVLALLAQGAGNERIAEDLVISPQTARTHVQNLITKLGVHSRLEAAMFAARSDILRDPDAGELEPIGG
jgi:DNA-binding NarL/FixJ family response regulator